MRRLTAMGAILTCLLILGSAPALASDDSSVRFFPETGQTVTGSFLSYFDSHGEVGVLGYPLTAEFEENGLTVQYFERARLEHHPENDAPFDVLQGLLGVEILAGQQFSAAEPFTSTQKALYFPETQHSLRGRFLRYWQDNGGLYVFGYPLSQQIQEVSATDGVTRTVQYFERARFEYHSDLKGTPYEMSLGQLGRELLAIHPAPPDAGNPELRALEEEMLTLINADRANVGVAPLRMDQLISQVARDHVRDMIENNNYSHYGTDGSTPVDRMRRAGVKFAFGGENFWGNGNPDRHEALREIEAAMMAEPYDPNVYNHHWMIVHDGYTRAGIGIGISPNGWLWVVEDICDG